MQILFGRLKELFAILLQIYLESRYVLYLLADNDTEDIWSLNGMFVCMHAL